MNNTVYNRIKTLAAEKNVSLAELERALGVGAGSISKWRKVNPSSDKVIKVANFFGVTTDYLLGVEDGIVPEQPDDLKDYLESAKYYDGKEIDPQSKAILNDVVASILKNRK